MFGENIKPHKVTTSEIKTVKVGKNIYIVDYAYIRLVNGNKQQRIKTMEGIIFDSGKIYKIKTANMQQSNVLASVDAAKRKLSILTSYGFTDVNKSIKLQGEL